MSEAPIIVARVVGTIGTMSPAAFHEYLVRLAVEAFDRAAADYPDSMRERFIAHARERLSQCATVYAAEVGK